MSVNAILNVGKQVYNVGKTFVKASPELAFGTSADKIGKVLKQAVTEGKSVKDTAKVTMQAVEKAGAGNFLAKTWKNIKTLVPDVTRYTKAGIKLAEKTGANKYTGALKGLAKGVGKKLPFVFAAILLVSEIPNILKATMEKGIFQGLIETAKPVARLTGAGVGAAIGSAICPGVGSLIGWVAGEWLAGRIVGKSYSEKQAEEQETVAKYIPQQPQIPVQPQVAVNPYAMNPYNFGTMPPFNGSNPYMNDFMMQQAGLNKMI